MTPKTVQKFTKELKVLYVEDDAGIRESTTELFKQFFDSVDVAEDGKQGLETYEKFLKESGDFYDFVITDINMPHMNGIEMIEAIHKKNHKQTVIVTSAHDDAAYLIPLIEQGIESFILKPFKMTALLTVFFKNAQKVMDRKFVRENFTQMKIRYKQLKDAFEELNRQKCEIEAKYQQLLDGGCEVKVEEVALKEEDVAASAAAMFDDSAYFAKDTDEGEDNILLLDEHSQDLLEYFDDIKDHIYNGSESPEAAAIKIVEDLVAVAGIFEFYSPYLDMIASAYRDLSDAIYRNMSSFTTILTEDLDSISTLFDAVYNDMQNYAERFKTESLAMKNIHHIHEPTALSIQQIVSVVNPEEVDAGEIEFF
jgi:DNA-binding response OmpR family regulator